MFGESISILKKDKTILICSLIPILIGLILYYFLGSWLYNDVMSAGNEYLKSKTEGLAGFLSYILGGLLFIGFYFLINWTFVLTVSLIGSPLNDIISTRAEKIKRGGELPSLGDSFSNSFSKLGKTIINEVKKISLILFLSIIAFVVSFIFPPLGYLISAILVAISFIDYSWSRHDLSFKKCISDYKKGIFRYTLGGGIFTILFGIPIINLISYPVAVIYFTLHFVRTNP